MNPNRDRAFRGFVTCIAAAVTSAVAIGAGMGERFAQDFRSRFDPAAFQIVGPNDAQRYWKIDQRGFHCTIRPKDAKVSTCGLLAKLELKGDFEITAGYEILALPRPSRGDGAGLRLSIADRERQLAGVERVCRPKGGDTYSAYRGERTRGAYRHSSKAKATKTRSGRLQLKRTGDTLFWRAAEGDSRDFTQLRHERFTRNDITELRLVADTGTSPTGIDAVWRDLEVRGDAVRLSYLPSERTTIPMKLFVLTGAGLAILVALAAWRRGRKRR